MYVILHVYKQTITSCLANCMLTGFCVREKSRRLVVELIDKLGNMEKCNEQQSKHLKSTSGSLSMLFA